ncbi:hypothetical protein ABIC89_000861 [Variovorax boronicumulans]|uniref:hypothetical protein n=1 Tax=Variovorax boronicumulans TaxID=436515 RepID=UPI0033929F64
MTWTFKPSDLKAVDLKNAKPGDFLCALRSGATYELWLRLAGNDPRASLMVNLTGSHAMEVWPVQAQGAVPTLLVASGADIELEIDDNKGVGPAEGTPGTLLIADSGAYLVAKIRNQGFTDEGCISLATWEFVAFHDVSNVRASFSTWRLVDSRESSNRNVLLSFGDWSRAQA